MADENQSVNDILVQALQNPDFQDTAAIARRNGNNVATQPGFIHDAQTMNDLQLRAKYGPEVAGEVFRLNRGEERIQDNEDYDPGFIENARNSLLDFAATTYEVSGNTVGQLAVRPMAKLFGVDPDAASAELASLTKYLGEETRSYRTDYANESSRIRAIESQLNSQDNFDEAVESVRSGDQTPFEASLRMVGRNFLDSGEQIVTDKEALREVIAGSAGSLAPSAAIARTGGMLAAKGIGLLSNSARAKALATTTGVALSIGGVEASGTYADTLNTVMDMDQNLISQSPIYQGLITEGYSPEEARVQLANLTAETAFKRQLPVATALGFLTSRFEAAPIGVFRGSNLVDGLRTIALQGLEETGQSASGQLSQNTAIRDNADPSKNVFEGVGEQAAAGLIGGLGQSTATSTPAAALDAPSAVQDAVNSLLNSGEQTYNDPVRQEIFGRGTNAQEAAAAVDGLVQSTREAVKPVVQAAKDRASQRDVQGTAEGVNAARETVLATEEAIQNGEASPEFVEAVSQPDTSPIPEGLLQDTGSFMGNVAQITESLGDTGFKPTDAQKAYAASQYIKLKGMLPSMPPAVQEQAKKMLRSPQVRKLAEDVKKIDLNQVQDDSTPITPDVVSETVSVAKTNPTNVNPTTVGKILEQSGENLSDDDVRLMQSAAKIAAAVNNRVDRQVQITNEQNVGLQKLGRTEKAEQINSDSVSRSVRVTGYTNKQGKNLRSVNDFASDIFQASQSPDGTFINDEGIPIKAEDIMSQFTKFIQHMNNKVGALNHSFQNNNRKGNGPNVYYDTLVDGNKFIPADQKGASKVFYNRSNPSSVSTARLVSADLQVAVDVYNELRNAFPDRFGSLPEATAETLLEDVGGYIDVDALNAEIDAQEASELAQIEAQDGGGRLRRDAVLKKEESLIDYSEDTNPTAIDDAVSPQADTAEEQNQQTQKEESKHNAQQRFLKAAELFGMLVTNSKEDPFNNKKFKKEVNYVDNYLKEILGNRERIASLVIQSGADKRISYDILLETHINEGVKWPFDGTKDFSASMAKNSNQFDLFDNSTTVEDEGSSERGEDESGANATDETSTNEEVTEDEQSPVELQDDGLMTDNEGNVITMYHGTNRQFDKFEGNRLFFTSQKSLATEHALREGIGKGARIIEANIKIQNPLLVEIQDDSDPDTHWLTNTQRIEQDFNNGNYDSILIYNQAGDSMVIATDNSQVIQLTPETQTETNRELTDENVQVYQPDDRPTRTVHENFYKAYQESGNKPPFDTLEGYVEEAKARNVNPVTIRFLEKLIRPLTGAMNKRIQNHSRGKFKVSETGRTGTLMEHLQDGVIQNYLRYRSTVLVDPKTGKYDQNLLDLAGIALVDWMVNAQARDVNQLEDTMKDLGVTYDQLTDEQMEAVIYGIPTPRVKDELGRNILRMWGMQENLDTPMSQLEGIVQGLAAEMLTTIAKNPKISLLEIRDIPVMVDGKLVSTQTIMVNGLSDIQKQVKEAETDENFTTAREAFFGDPRESYSIGTPLKSVAQTQNRSNVQLSRLERTALKKMQDTPHYKDEGRVALFESMGGEAIARLFGYVSDWQNVRNKTLRRSIMGKNISIEKNIQDASTLVDKINENNTPVFFPVGITKVGRHQYQGVNPQNNKILRMLVSPTWSELTFSKEDMDKFWTGIAQAADLMKVEKNNIQTVIDTVQGEFNGKYREATDMIKEWLRTGKINGEALVESILKGEEAIEPQVLAAIHAVAEMEFYSEQGVDSFRTSLSFELDGLTNGAANMMVNMGQGEITREDHQNMNRIGFFMGKVGKTVNDYFSARRDNGDKNYDLYETVSRVAEKMTFAKMRKANPEERAQMEAASRFAVWFGDFKMIDGQPRMTRNTAKNPMTKVNYGSGVQGVGDGIADDMVLEFYRKIQGVPNGTNLQEYFGYAEIYEDIQTLFDGKLSTNLDEGAFEFPPAAVENFRNSIGNTIGKTLTEATEQVLGIKIKEFNDMMVFSTNVQAQYQRLLFQKKLEEMAEKRAQEGKIRRVEKGKNAGKPVMADLTRRDYQTVMKEVEKLSPIFVSDDQSLAIGGFQKASSDLVFSANLDEKLNQKAQLPMPEEVGVRAIPFSVIGTGDAMMMNLIFGSENAPNDVLGIFDGLDVPVGKVQEYAPFVNEQVMKTWERDVMGMAVANFNGFLSQVGSDTLLDEAFQMVRDKSKKSSVTAKSAQELSEQLGERLRQNKARKAVFKRIPVSVDQMGGSGVGYTRGEEDLSMGEINRMIENELNGKPQQDPVDESALEIQETTVDAVLSGMRLSTEQRSVVALLKEQLPNTRVIIGTVSQLNAYRKENFPDDGQFMRDVNGMYDVTNDVIYLTKTKSETVIHEMVHAATFSKVLDHYNGNTNDAVTRMEALMDEFMALETQGKNANEAKAAILRHQAQNDPVSQAAAVNEFMAYALSNTQVRNKLKKTETKTLQGLAQKVIALMKRLMGGVPTSMFDQVVFNTKVIIEGPLDNGDNGDGGGNGNDDGGSNGENTPSFESYGNFWIDTLRDYLTQHDADVKALRTRRKPIRKFSEDAENIINGYRQVGMLTNPEARATFAAIYMAMAAEMKLNSKSIIGMTRMFQYIEENLTPEMFEGAEGNQEYSAVINSFGSYKNGDISDAVAVLLALSQTSQKFRKALDQIPDPEGNIQSENSIAEFLGVVSSGMMRKLFSDVNTSKGATDIIDNLAASMLDLDQKREYRILNRVTSSFDAMDKYTGGKLSQLSNITRKKNAEVQASTRNRFTKAISNGVTLGTNLLDRDNSKYTAEASKRATHMNVPVLSLVPIREFVSEVIGTDADNMKLVALQDKVNSRISGLRQAYREDLPGILQNLFKTSPNASQWSSMHVTLGQTDFTRFVDVSRMQHSMSFLEEGAKRATRISQLEQAIDSNYLPYIAQDAKDKAQQLAKFMNGGGAGKLLMRNAYAIAKNLDGDFQESMVEVIDELVTMYAIDQMDADVREETVQLWQNDPEAVKGMITYIQGLNEAEDNKTGISEQARLNGYKGYIPNHGDKDTRIVIAPTDAKKEMEARGFTQVGDYGGDVGNYLPRSYYVSNLSNNGAYSQGIMQNVQSTYRGVDINTGVTVTGETYGLISDEASVDYITQELNDPSYIQQDDKEALLPVFDFDGALLGYERGINPDIYKKHMNQEQNLAVMLGAWAGRHVEEMLAEEYNRTLVDELDRIWQNRETGTDDMFVNLKTTKDPIYRESFSLIPKGIKEYMDDKFEGNGPMIRKDMANLSVGYREAGLSDMWTGKTRLPKGVQEAVQHSTQFLFGKNALPWLSRAEKIGLGAVSTAKDIIVIRSLVVPMMNTKANVIQLATNGVPAKQIAKGFRSKLAEVEEYQKNVSKKIELEAKLRLAASNANQRRILKSQIQVIDDLNARMSIAPMIEAGAFKNLSEGITDLDVSLTNGNLTDYMDNLADKLPGKLSSVAKLGIVSKSTKVYQVANRATQYGDFLAKSIYYDYLRGYNHRHGQFIDGLSHEEAIARVNEEFVNFSFLPGRVRSGLERYGLMWFMAFKIRIMKIALRQIRENPMRALAVNSLLPDEGSPIQDNLGSVIADGRIDYALGYEMGLNAPSMNPWINLID